MALLSADKSFGGDIGTGGNGLGQGAETLVDHVGDGLTGGIDAGLDDVGGLAGALTNGRCGGVDAAGHAAFGIGDLRTIAAGRPRRARLMFTLETDLAGDEA